ncbi:hypothetical protein Bbelb_237630 [Branchiostoma belcheri]|nr:hypothetical protein Bbelb_237630 [Branchiostoma belcheri]
MACPQCRDFITTERKGGELQRPTSLLSAWQDIRYQPDCRIARRPHGHPTRGRPGTELSGSWNLALPDPRDDFYLEFNRPFKMKLSVCLPFLGCLVLATAIPVPRQDLQGLLTELEDGLEELLEVEMEKRVPEPREVDLQSLPPGFGENREKRQPPGQWLPRRGENLQSLPPGFGENREKRQPDQWLPRRGENLQGLLTELEDGLEGVQVYVVMAEAVLSQITGDFLECTICLEPYKDPKILPCLHTFCKGCLEKFVANQGEAKDRFPCPTCRIETVLPEGGVTELKNNFFVLSLRHTVDAHRSLTSVEDNKVVCDLCEEEMASCGCVVCEEFLCDECSRGHRRTKRTRDHEVIGVAELKEQLITKTSSVKSRSLPMCPKHEDEKLKFYCETCQHPICRDCTVLQHKDHKYGYLIDVVSDVRAKIKGNLEAARPQIQEYRDAAGVVAEKQAELDTRSKKAADDIDAAAEEEIKYYTGLVRRKQTELKEKLAAVTAARSKQLSATADSVESTLGCLSSTVDFSQKVVEHGSDFDVMNVYSDVTARLESLLKGPTPDIPNDISYVRFYPRTERREAEIILGDVVDSSSFRTAKLTTLGASGRLGPTTLGTHYKGQDHEHLVTLHDGIQHFTVPRTGTYSIEAAGRDVLLQGGVRKTRSPPEDGVPY